MIKTILWDFDGVILDSMKIKGDGFVELFKSYEISLLNELVEYHYTHGGVSRFDKIKYFYNTILNETISEEKIISLSDEFATIIAKKLFDKNNLIDETVDFIEKNHNKYNFHIVSGAEHQELNNLCAMLDLNEFFKSIDGSPVKKDVLVKNVLKKYNYQKEDTILIGDALTDYNAAVKNDIEFYGFNNKSLIEKNYIFSFKDFL